MKVFLLTFLLLAAGGAQAQEYGHMNLGNLLDMMPETRRANQALKSYTDQLTAKKDSMSRAFTAAYANVEKLVSEGTIPPMEIVRRQDELQKKQEEIQQFEQEAQQKIAAKREEMSKPIMDRIDQAVKNVAKANGYVMVFDTSSGGMLFADDSIDILPLVKEELGLNK